MLQKEAKPDKQSPPPPSPPQTSPNPPINPTLAQLLQLIQDQLPANSKKSNRPRSVRSGTLDQHLHLASKAKALMCELLADCVERIQQQLQELRIDLLITKKGINDFFAKPEIGKAMVDIMQRQYQTFNKKMQTRLGSCGSVSKTPEVAANLEKEQMHAYEFLDSIEMLLPNFVENCLRPFDISKLTIQELQELKSKSELACLIFPKLDSILADKIALRKQKKKKKRQNYLKNKRAQSKQPLACTSTSASTETTPQPTQEEAISQEDQQKQEQQQQQGQQIRVRQFLNAMIVNEGRGGCHIDDDWLKCLKFKYH